MKNRSRIALITGLLFTLSAALADDTTAGASDQITTLNSPFEVNVENIYETKANPNRIVELNYSLLPTSFRASQSINKEIRTFVRNQLDSFVNSLPTPPGQLSKVDAKFKLSDQVTLQKRNELYSVRYEIFSFYAGQAHPVTQYICHTYHLKNQTLLSLSDILQNPDEDLMFISNYVISVLKKRNLQPSELINEGASPKMENYQCWNLTKDGLRITFNAAQVAAYVYGEQSVVLPYAILKGHLKTEFVD